MTDGTVTEAVRALLVEGLTSGEIIAKGYRPGIVFRVQRSLRLAAALAAEPQGMRATDETEEQGEMLPDPEDEFEDEESTDDRVAELEAELCRVDQELCELREFVEDRFRNFDSQFSRVTLELSPIKGQVTKIERAIPWLREAAEDAITLLGSQTIEPPNPWDWLVPPVSALNRIRRRLVEIHPVGARELFGDRIGEVLSADGLIDTPPKRRTGEQARPR